MALELTPEAKSILDLYDERCRRIMLEGQQRTADQIGELRREVTTQVNQMRTEVFERLEQMSACLGQATIDLSAIKARLDSGDHRFARQDAELVRLKQESDGKIQRLEDRINTLERQGATISGGAKAAIVGLGIAGGATGAVIMRAMLKALGQ